jgi:hypothetical protein
MLVYMIASHLQKMPRGLYRLFLVLTILLQALIGAFLSNR